MVQLYREESYSILQVLNENQGIIKQTKNQKTQKNPQHSDQMSSLWKSYIRIYVSVAVIASGINSITFNPREGGNPNQNVSLQIEADTAGAKSSRNWHMEPISKHNWRAPWWSVMLAPISLSPQRCLMNAAAFLLWKKTLPTLCGLTP